MPNRTNTTSDCLTKHPRMLAKNINKYANHTCMILDSNISHFNISMIMIPAQSKISPEFGAAVSTAETGGVEGLLIGHKFLQRVNGLMASDASLSH